SHGREGTDPRMERVPGRVLRDVWLSAQRSAGGPVPPMRRLLGRPRPIPLIEGAARAMNTAIPGAAGVSVIPGAAGVYLAAGRVIAMRKERSPLRIAANKRDVAKPLTGRCERRRAAWGVPEPQLAYGGVEHRHVGPL